MASIRTIVVGKSTLEWNTGVIRSLYYNPDEVTKVFKEVIRPNLKIKEVSDIRSAVSALVENEMKKDTFKMHQFCTLILALKETEIDTTEVDDDKNYKIYRICYDDQTFHQRREKITYYNIAYHMNHHCRQLWRCCFVRVTYPFNIQKNIAYTTGEWQDNDKDDTLDSIDEFKEDRKRKKLEKKNHEE